MRNENTEVICNKADKDCGWCKHSVLHKSIREFNAHTRKWQVCNEPSFCFVDGKEVPVKCENQNGK